MTLLCVFKLELGIIGIWVGPAIAVAFNTLAYLHLFSKFDIEKLIQESKDRQARDLASKKAETTKVEDGFKKAE